MSRFLQYEGLGGGQLPPAGSPTSAPSPTPKPTPSGPTGYYPNGSTNPVWKAAVAGVKAGTRRGRISVVADSTLGAGIGSGGTVTTPSGPQNLDNARAHRMSTLLAASYSAAGVPMLDAGLYGDNGTGGGGRYASSGVDLPTYDHRVTPTGVIGRSLFNPNWSQTCSEAFGGGALLAPSSNVMDLLPTQNVDTFEVTMYTGAAGQGGLTIDNGAPAAASGGAVISGSYALYTMPAVHSSDRSGGGAFVTFTVKAGAVGSHTFGMNGPAGNTLALRSIVPYDSTTAAFDIRVQAAGGATAADQSTAGADSGGVAWNCLDALGYDAPDLTIICLGINDNNGGVTPSAYIASLQKIVAKAQLTGDVLIVMPYPVGSSTDASQQAMNTAAKNMAASANIPLLSLLDYYGPYTSTIGVRSQGDGVHWIDYSEPTGLVKQALDAMLAA